MANEICSARVAHLLVLSALLASVCPWALAEAPDLELNPVTGLVESVDIATDDGDRVRHVIDRGKGSTRIVTLVSDDAGSSPRIAISSDGDSWVVWWEDNTTDEVYYAIRDEETDTWDAETLLSDAAQNSAAPEIVHDGMTAWVAYEVKDGSSTTITVQGIMDGPEPIPQDVGTTSYAGDVDVLVHLEVGHLWVTWVDSANDVGWSEYDDATDLWSAPDYGSYSGTTITGVRDEIRTTVLGL